MCIHLQLTTSIANHLITTCMGVSGPLWGDVSYARFKMCLFGPGRELSHTNQEHDVLRGIPDERPNYKQATLAY